MVIVSTDKELDQIPGVHYNWVKDEIYKIDSFNASRNMWMRVLSGDSTANIQGIPGMGPKKADKYFDQFEPHEWEGAVLEMFVQTYPLGMNVFDEHVSLVKLGAPKTINEAETVEVEPQGINETTESGANNG